MADEILQGETALFGLDLGFRHDYSALSVMLIDHIERTEVFPLPSVDYQPVDRVPLYSVVHLQRWIEVATKDVLSQVRNVMDHPRLALRERELIIDASGLGLPVVEVAEGMGLEPIAITITSGYQAHRGTDGLSYSVPRRVLIFSVLSAYQAGQIKIAAELPLLPALDEELANLRVKQTAAGGETYDSWKSTQHDDMVMSLAMCVWRARQVAGAETVLTKELLGDRKYEGDSWDSLNYEMDSGSDDENDFRGTWR